MVDYRVYLLNPAGSIVRGWDLRQPTDAATLDHVRATLKPGQLAEVWQGTRRLGLLNADDGTTNSPATSSPMP